MSTEIIELAPLQSRARGIRKEIAEAVTRSSDSPIDRFKLVHNGTPPDLFRVLKVGRLGFRNVIEATGINPEREDSLYLEFTSEKCVPEPEDFISFGNGRLWVLDPSATRREFKARELSMAQFDELVDRVRL